MGETVVDLHFQRTEPAVVVGDSNRMPLRSFGSPEAAPLYAMLIRPRVGPTVTVVTYLPVIDVAKGTPALALLGGKLPLEE